MKKIVLLTTLLSSLTAIAQIDARLFRFPDVSVTQIAFVYGGDSGLCQRAVVQRTVFSPDGKTLAFSATYDGNTDVYTMPVTGGIPVRLTWYGDIFCRSFFKSKTSTFQSFLQQF